MAAEAVAHRGVRTGALPGSGHPARDRPVRGDSTVTTPTMLGLIVLADDTPHNTGPDFGKAGPFGLVIVVLLLIATFALVWSMNRHLRKLPESFDQSEQEQVEEDPKRESSG